MQSYTTHWPSGCLLSFGWPTMNSTSVTILSNCSVEYIAHSGANGSLALGIYLRHEWESIESWCPSGSTLSPSVIIQDGIRTIAEFIQHVKTKLYPIIGFRFVCWNCFYLIVWFISVLIIYFECMHLLFLNTSYNFIKDFPPLQYFVNHCASLWRKMAQE